MAADGLSEDAFGREVVLRLIGLFADPRSYTWSSSREVEVDDVRVTGERPDAELLITFRLGPDPSLSDRTFGAHHPLGRSIFGEVEASSDRAADLANEVAIWLDEAIHTWLRRDQLPGADGIAWIN